MSEQSKSMDELKEKLAVIEHDRWADWQRYVHDLCAKLPDGSLRIPAGKVKHWEGQIKTRYVFLSQKEMDSDREQVDRYWPLIVKLLADQKARAVEIARDYKPKLKDKGVEVSDGGIFVDYNEAIATKLTDEL